MNDEEVERYLSEFQPRPVRTLVVCPRNERVWALRSIAAVSIIFVGGISFWYLRQETKGTRHAPTAQQVWPSSALLQDNLNAIALTRLALENDERFEKFLADKSRTVLPSFQGENSAFRALAKE
jgi:hypothetical protein